jgi:hypothetical protein
MDRKKILILALALIVLFGGIFLVARTISNKEGVAKSSTNPTQKSVTEKKGPVNLFGQNETGAQQKTTSDATGTVDVIAEKTLTIKTNQEPLVVSINGATPVMLAVGKNAPVAGQMADLKKGDSVKVTYDQATKAARLILITR